MTKKGEQFLILEMAVFGVLSLIFFLGGAYFFLWRPFVENKSAEWQYLGFALLFFAMITSMLLYFRMNMLLLNMEMEKRLAMQKKHLEQLNRTCEGILWALNYALDYRDHETWGHSVRVVGYAVTIGRAMNLTDEELTLLAWGGFYDIGKIGYPMPFKAALLMLKSGRS